MEARKEIINYADTVTKMFTQTRFLFSVSNETEFKNIFTLVEHYEDICDEMEVDIANYLNKVSTEEPSADLKRAICGMLREVAEIESIGDSCHHIAHTARRNYQKHPTTHGKTVGTHSPNVSTDRTNTGTNANHLIHPESPKRGFHSLLYRKGNQ